MIKIGLLGLGTIGSGVYEIIEERKDYFTKLLGKEVVIDKILVRDLSKDRNVNFDKQLLTTNPQEVLHNDEIDIIVEVMGGISPAYEYICKALENGKHVVTANKAVIEAHMTELFELAKENRRGLLFEASVGGGIPIIKPLSQAIKTNSIRNIKGILNGTTNFILTKMYDESLSFDEALNLAHENGYAEADPTDDIEGFDAARKIAILSSIAYSTRVKLNSVYCRGISYINQNDIKAFKKLNLIVKLIATSIFADNKYSISVEPVLLDKCSSFGNVNDAFNIVSFTGDMVGDLQFYGLGAGKNATANSIVSDILDTINGEHEYYNLCDNTIKPVGEKLLNGRYYLRITLNDDEDATDIIEVLCENNIEFNILTCLGDFVCITKEISARYMNELVKSLSYKWDDICYVRIDRNSQLSNNSFGINEAAATFSS